jgi:hypothetical protein
VLASRISRSSAQIIINLLKLEPFKTISNEWQKHDYTNRVNFCSWILQCVHDGIIAIHLIFLPDRTFFYLHQGVNLQNNRFTNSSQSPRFHYMILKCMRNVV